MSYVVTIAGGQKVANHPDPGKAALAAKDLLDRGYTVWIRNTDSLETTKVIELNRKDGTLAVLAADPEPSWAMKVRRMLDQL